MADTRRRILEAARVVVAEQGFAAAQVAVVASEVIECVGGNGYIEEHPLPRSYREAPLNAIWEGTSNMMVLDVARVLEREPKAAEPLLDEIRAASGAEPSWATPPPTSKRSSCAPGTPAGAS